jgi:ubiquinol-cytochrome c reductase cytochrome b subunit
MRVSFFVLPVIAFFVTRHVCVALQRADRRRLRVGHRYAIASQSPDGAAARPGPDGAVTRPEPAVLVPGQPDGHVVVPEPELSYASVSSPLTEQERERLTAHRPDELIRPIPRHLIPLPTPRRIAAQVRARLNHYYLVSALEPPYKTRASNGQSAKESVKSDKRPTRE